MFYLRLQKKMENLLGSFQSKKKKKHGFLFVGSIYIKRKPIIVLIEQDLGHDMGFKFEDLISKMVREKLFFNSCSNSVSIVAYIVKKIF